MKTLSATLVAVLTLLGTSLAQTAPRPKYPAFPSETPADFKPVAESFDYVRRDVMMLRRICLPQREIIHRLARGDYPGITEKAAIYFRDIYDNLYRIVDAAMQYQDLVQGTMDAYLSSVNNRLNETMKRLTVISALLMPLTVITGIYGMNFDFMPELRWRYGYLAVLAVMATMCAVLIYWFKKKQWI